MRFVIRTTYDQKALTIMSRVLRKTLRRKSSRRSTVFGALVVILAGVLLLFRVSGGNGFDARDGLTFAVAVVIIVTFCTQDVLNGWLAGRKMLPGTEKGETVFERDGYVTTTAAAETHWKHSQIKAAYETKDYFVFFLSDRHGQIYDKHGFLEGSSEEFREFISEQTGKPVEYIK